SNRCENERGDGSADSSCSGDSFAETSGACPGFCAGHSTACDECSSQFGCGWCQTATGTQCLEFGGNGSRPKNATCQYVDWSLTPEDCEWRVDSRNAETRARWTRGRAATPRGRPGQLRESSRA